MDNRANIRSGWGKIIFNLIMKKILILISSILISTNLIAAGGDGGSSSSGNGDSKVSLYDDAVKLVKRAGKLEKKEKTEKAKKLYSQAFKKLDKANERLEVLKGCNCEEYGELELIIKTRGTKVY